MTTEDLNPAERYLTPATRKWIYQISIAVAPLMAGIGIMSGGMIQTILVLIAAVLTVGTNGLASSKVK
jgi:uncharacterized membrane protein|tara:strand:- start:27 stop:230 length:204 start_codon:yes stop_codon:yes gene_type:complete